MTDDPVEDPTEDDDEPAGEPEEEGASVLVPEFLPGASGLGQVLRMEDVRNRYGEETEQFVRERLGLGFAVRLLGGRFASGHVDSIEGGETITALGRATAWINNSLFGRRTVPGLGYASSFASLVVQLTRAPDEDMLPDAAGREVAPTAISGRWLAALSLAEEDQLFRAAEVLRPRATGTYLSALERIAESEASMEWLTLDGLRPREVTATRGQIIDTIEVLAQPVGTARRPVDVEGIIYAADQYGHTFKMDVTAGGDLDGRTIRGKYPSAANESLEGAWRKKVRARLAVIEAERPGLPRSPNTTYELVSVTRILDEPVPVEPPNTLFDVAA